MPQLFTAKQVAERTQFGVETIRKMARARIIPSYKVGPNSLRFDLEAVFEALANRTPGQPYANK